MTEKEAIELATAEKFVGLYNSQMGTSFSIVEHSDSPDLRCQDKEGNKLNLEITLTEDRPGDIQALLGRSDARSPEAMKRHKEAEERGEESIFDTVSCLGGNVVEMARARIQTKLSKDYGPDAALVVRDVSPLGWDWETVIDGLASVLDHRNNPFDKGIWVIDCGSNKIFRIV
jgi:hypothetical protein